MPSISNILFFILFFILFYLDPIQLGLSNWAQLWKTAFIAFVLLYLIRKKIYPQKIWLIYCLFALKFLICDAIFFFPNNTFAIFIKNLFFPTTLAFFYNHSYFKKQDNILYSIKFFSIFIVLSAIPFILEIIPTLSQGYVLSSVSYDDSVKGFVGLFQRPHGAANTMAYSFISLAFLFSISKNGYWKIVYISLITLNLYLLFATYVRTGLLMASVGLIIFIFYKRNIKKLFFLIPLFFVGAFFVYNIVSSNETLVRRIEGGSIYREDDEFDLNDISSGRFVIWESTLKSWTQNNDLFEIFFGIGEDELLIRNNNNCGFKVFAHNGYLNILVTNGVIGILIYFLFLIYWIKLLIMKIRMSRTITNFERYYIAVLFQYLIFMLFQGGHLVYDGIFIALSISLLQRSCLVKINYQIVNRDKIFCQKSEKILL